MSVDRRAWTPDAAVDEAELFATTRRLTIIVKPFLTALFCEDFYRVRQTLQDNSSRRQQTTAHGGASLP